MDCIILFFNQNLVNYCWCLWILEVELGQDNLSYFNIFGYNKMFELFFKFYCINYKI